MSWTVDPMHTQVEFSASSVAATIDVSTLSTYDKQRDGHLKSPDFLDDHQPQRLGADLECGSRDRRSARRGPDQDRAGNRGLQ